MGFIWIVQSRKMPFIVAYLLHLPKCVFWPQLNGQGVLLVGTQELPLSEFSRKDKVLWLLMKHRWNGIPSKSRRISEKNLSCLG